MSLIKCPGCKKEISSTYKYCVHCGFKLDKSKKKNSILDWIGIIFLLVWATSFCNTSKNNINTSKSDIGLVDEYKKAVKLLEDGVKKDMERFRENPKLLDNYYYECVRIIQKECASHACFLDEIQVSKIRGVDKFCTNYKKDFIDKNRVFNNPYFFYPQSMISGFCPFPNY